MVFHTRTLSASILPQPYETPLNSLAMVSPGEDPGHGAFRSLYLPPDLKMNIIEELLGPYIASMVPKRLDKTRPTPFRIQNQPLYNRISSASARMYLLSPIRPFVQSTCGSSSTSTVVISCYHRLPIPFHLSSSTEAKEQCFRMEFFACR